MTCSIHPTSEPGCKICYSPFAPSTRSGGGKVCFKHIFTDNSCPDCYPRTATATAASGDTEQEPLATSHLVTPPLTVDERKQSSGALQREARQPRSSRQTGVAESASEADQPISDQSRKDSKVGWLKRTLSCGR